MIDWLPLDGSDKGSILRFDHIQPVGFHHSSIEPTEWRLSEDARAIIYEWLCWYFEGSLDGEGMLAYWIQENARD